MGLREKLEGLKTSLRNQQDVLSSMGVQKEHSVSEVRESDFKVLLDNFHKEGTTIEEKEAIIAQVAALGKNTVDLQTEVNEMKNNQKSL